MELHCLKRKQRLAVGLEEAWEFFSAPANLGLITPEWLDLTVTSAVPDKMYCGMMITYRLKPFWGVAVDWISEITHAREPFFFVDEQRFGPYRFWRHQHFFARDGDGVEVVDVVHYILKFGLLGRFIHRSAVRRRLETIFDHRRDELARRFGPL